MFPTNLLFKFSPLKRYFVIRSARKWNGNQTRCFSFDGVSSLEISQFNIKKSIKSSGNTFEDGFTCIKTQCPACVPETEQPKNIYIDKITGNMVCPSCQMTAKWKSIEQFYGLSSTKDKSNKERDRLREIFFKLKPKITQIKSPSASKSVRTMSKTNLNDILTFLEIQFISQNFLENQQVFYATDSNTLYFPLKDAEENIVGYRSLTKVDDTFQEVTSPEQNCFGIITTKIGTGASVKREISQGILVLNIVDLLALTTIKTNSHIICLPYGLKSLPPECLPALEKYTKLILWFDYDAVGWDAAKIFARKLDEKRCFVIRPTDHHPTPYRALKEALELKGILAQAHPILHKSITTFSSLRQDVLSDLQNIDKVQGVKWQRFPVLNKLLKGHRKGELTVLTGPTGCGKTTFMSEYSLDLAMQGVTTLWGSFEIRNTRLASTLLRQLAGHPLDNDLATFDRWADEFERLPLYFMTFHGQQIIKVVMEAIEHAQYVHDIHHVIIDNVQFMMGTLDEVKHVDRFWKQDSIIASFRTFATRRNCHVTLVIHPRKERDAEDLTTSSIFGSAKATQEADNVLIIQDKRLTAIRGKKYLQIAKNRFTGDLGIMPLDFDKAGLSYAPKKKKLSEEKPTTEDVAAKTVAIREIDPV